MTGAEAKTFVAEFAKVPDDAVGEKLRAWVDARFQGGVLEWVVSLAVLAKAERGPS